MKVSVHADDQKKENGKRRKDEVQNTTKKTKDKKVLVLVHLLYHTCNSSFISGRCANEEVLQSSLSCSDYNELLSHRDRIKQRQHQSKCLLAT
jgi:hypothetical protein